MKVIKEGDKIDYMNSIPLRAFVSENIMIDCGNFVYQVLISRMSSDVINLRPIQQTDAERYGYDPRVLYIRTAGAYNCAPIVSLGTMSDDGINWNVNNSYREGSRVQQHIHTWGATSGSTTRWVTSSEPEQPTERTPAQEREYSTLRQVYNRTRRILGIR